MKDGAIVVRRLEVIAIVIEMGPNGVENSISLIQIEAVLVEKEVEAGALEEFLLGIAIEGGNIEEDDDFTIRIQNPRTFGR